MLQARKPFVYVWHKPIAATMLEAVVGLEITQTLLLFQTVDGTEHIKLFDAQSKAGNRDDGTYHK